MYLIPITIGILYISTDANGWFDTNDKRNHPFPGQGRAAAQELPALPRRGDLLDDDGKLWRVEMIAFAAVVDVYAIPLSSALTEETRRENGKHGPTLRPRPIRQRKSKRSCFNE